MTDEQPIDSRSFLDRPYLERQMIVVVDDAVAESMRQAARSVQQDTSTDRWTQIGKIATAILIGDLGYALARETIDAWRRFREDGIRLLQIGQSESEAAEFPPGHPRDKVIYVGHPVRPTVYYTASHFHRVTFEHKFSEAVDLLMYLGATSIRVEHVYGWSKDFAVHLSTPLSQVGGEIGVEVGTKHESASRLLFEATLAGRTDPVLPKNLVWYAHEPTWQSIANGRLNFGLRNFNLNVSYEDDFGVNAGLKARATKVGFDLGGKFEDHTATTWKIQGQFCGS